MQAMAKSGNSKIIFMPGPTNSGDFGLPGVIDEGAPGASSVQRIDPLQHAVNAQVLDNM